MTAMRTPGRLLLPLLAVVLFAGGCGAGMSTDQGPDTSFPVMAATMTAAAPTTSLQPPSSALTAAQLVQALAKAGTITAPVVQDANTDPNHQIGRAGGYVGRASFDLPGGDQGSAAGETRRGGSLEVYADPAGAQRRGAYLGGLASAAPEMASEYTYVHGVVVLRIAKEIAPATAKQVDAQLVAIVGG